MAASSRLTMGPRKSTARQPLVRPPPARAQSMAPSMPGRATPTESAATTSVPTKSPARSVNGGPAGIKRKERDFEQDVGVEEETNINVVVRCRGRSDREVRENSGVVVSTEGVKGKKVDLSMGPSALSNKTYNFDKVFSPAADQEMIFNEVVSPILDEVLGGFNCTIFAYGQTGTGKTYTMSGDITDTQPLPEAAGIIPRVLYALFDRLGDDDGENSVKCSFIELYNEELRDLLSSEDNAKLKIYDDNSKKGQTTTLVQGMEESHIKSASKGLDLLKQGSYKRQVAATKCNDLSSRSHTVFTVTVYMKKTSDTGEDFVSAGKLNLVDLAGSENIQRSGAENKRAAEAGLINKSLLTLGRVINALVEKSTHIPYRESKLTRLLQDSLGGRTKTCIVATLSPAKSNLEETISTLDYAFRAKNIRNKPQANQMVSKKTLLREFTSEIEKLKMELMATRQRNGVYLTAEAYDEIKTESESRRILSEEQRDKITLMETSLRTKVQELFSLTGNFNTLKKDVETTRAQLDGTTSVLEKTELVLAHTRKALAEESYISNARAANEAALRDVGNELLAGIETTTGDVAGLHAKLRRRSALHASNRDVWDARATRVATATEGLDGSLAAVGLQQDNMLVALSERMQTFVAAELSELGASRVFLADKVDAFNSASAEVAEQTAAARDHTDVVVGEIGALREDVRAKVAQGMEDLTQAAGRIGAGIATELEAFHSQLHGAFAGLGREFKALFEDATRQLAEQKAEAENLQSQLIEANAKLAEAHRQSQLVLSQAMAVERETARSEREEILARIGEMVHQSAQRQEERLTSHMDAFTTTSTANVATHAETQQAYTDGMEAWSSRSTALQGHLSASRDAIKAKLKSDWSAANTSSESIKRVADAVHSETLAIATAQTSATDAQLASLDDIMARIREQTSVHHAAHTSSLSRLASDVEAGYASVGGVMASSHARVEALEADMQTRLLAARDALAPSLAPLRTELATLAAEARDSKMQDYVPTGSTPSRSAYAFPTALPRVVSERDALLERMRGGRSPRQRVWQDNEVAAPAEADGGEEVVMADALVEEGQATLRELDPNTPLLAQDAANPMEAAIPSVEAQQQPTTTSSSAPSSAGKGGPGSKIPSFGRAASTGPGPRAAAAGVGKATTRKEKENVLPSSLGEKVIERLEAAEGRRSGRIRSRGSN